MAHHKAIYFVCAEERNNKNRHKFRQLAREVSGEVFDIPEDNRVIFAYEKRFQQQTVIGEVCFQLASNGIDSPGSNFDTEYYNMINFMFVKTRYQGMGIGRMLIDKTMEIVRLHSVRDIRVQSAERAVGFFMKMGFKCKGDGIESLCGVRLFRFIVNMEKSLAENWDEELYEQGNDNG